MESQNFSADAENRFNRIGRGIAQSLNENVNAVPHEIAQRLKMMRINALAMHRKIYFHVVPRSRRNNLPQGLNSSWGWWKVAALALPVVTLVGSVLFFNEVDDVLYTQKIAAVDTRILTSELPPNAYADPGFAQFVASGVSDEGGAATMKMSAE